jgi:hypothetical protein
MVDMNLVLRALRRRFHFSEGTAPHDEADMLFEVGKAPEALLYSLLFVPTFLLVQDSVMLTQGSDDIQKRFIEAKKAGRISLPCLEASFNRVEISFLFANKDFDDEEEFLLTQRIVEAWQGALMRFCPDRRFVVYIVPAEENAGNIAVEFYEDREGENRHS